ncbi:Major facilitator superfamily domain, general substrate transporter [Artemisia annua]|uniref:Major facilitator superfamily domain, general substrate transporter n=1 Tax=Artemisia annua TaxID=35608 RepID=A0A2U1PSL6_ARTAN|nr:Major facilitator superfamily domain, general substrate transporter [Artemisia annua]
MSYVTVLGNRRRRTCTKSRDLVVFLCCFTSLSSYVFRILIIFLYLKCFLQLWVALVLAANSSAWLGTAVLVTNLRNFPLSRGTVAGLLKGYIALSAAVFTEVMTMILNGSASAILLVFTLGIPIICLSLMYYVRPCTPSSEIDPSENAHFLFTQGTSLLLAIFLLTTTILKNSLNLDKTMSYTFIAIMVVLLLSPLAIPIKMTLFPARKKLIRPTESSDSLVSGDGDSKTDPLLTPSSSNANLVSYNDNDDGSGSDVNTLLAVGEGAIKIKKRRPRRGDDFSFREAMVKADFWLLWTTYFLARLPELEEVLKTKDESGSIVVFQAELDQVRMCYASGEKWEACDSGVNLLSYNDDVDDGYGSDVNMLLVNFGIFCRLNAIPRTFWTMATQVIMVLTYLSYESALNGTLYAATALLGTCYGVQIVIMISTSSELFGLKNFGIIFNFMQLGNPLGALLFSGMLAGYIYDTEEARQGATMRMGPACFLFTVLVLACV